MTVSFTELSVHQPRPTRDTWAFRVGGLALSVAMLILALVQGTWLVAALAALATATYVFTTVLTIREYQAFQRCRCRHICLRFGKSR